MAKTILFQGDSITDAGRNRNLGIDMPNTSMGGGYATIVSGELGYNFPGEYICLNRGVGGTGMASMYSRIREDLIELKPDYLSFLAGVNDAWFDLGGRDYQPVSAEKGAGGVWHCFGESVETAKLALNMGLSFSIGGTVTFSNNRRAVEAVEYIPLESILLETDAPYLAPTPHRGKRNSSLYIHLVAEKVAEIKGITTEEVVNATTENAKKLFGI